MEPDERPRSVTARPTRGVLPAGSAHLVNEVVRAAAGGPQQYTGRLMGPRIATAGFPRERASFMEDEHRLAHPVPVGPRAWWPRPASGRRPVGAPRQVQTEAPQTRRS
jgi:hypothetical protein